MHLVQSFRGEGSGNCNKEVSINQKSIVVFFFIFFIFNTIVHVIVI